MEKNDTLAGALDYINRAYERLPVAQAEKPSLTPLDICLIRTLQGHTSDVTAVALTADGRRAVSGLDDKDALCLGPGERPSAAGTPRPFLFG